MSDLLARARGSKPTVYFIDDSATMREVVKIAFRRENFNVVTCADMADSFPPGTGARAHHEPYGGPAGDLEQLVPCRWDDQPSSVRLRPSLPNAGTAHTSTVPPLSGWVTLNVPSSPSARL